jgi:hypothetical protein
MARFYGGLTVPRSSERVHRSISIDNALLDPETSRSVLQLTIKMDPQKIIAGGRVLGRCMNVACKTTCQNFESKVRQPLSPP